MQIWNFDMDLCKGFFQRLHMLENSDALHKSFKNADSCEFHRNSVFRAVSTTELCMRFGEVVEKSPLSIIFRSLHSALPHPIFEPRF